MIDVTKSPELQASILALKGARRDIARDINKAARQTITPAWRQHLAQHAQTRMDTRVLVDRARVTVSERRFRLVAATGKALSGGLDPRYEWAGDEFGMTPRRSREFTQRSRKGKAYTRRMIVGRQFPARRAQGRVAFHAAAEVGHLLVAEWVRTIVSELAKLPAAKVTPR